MDLTVRDQFVERWRRFFGDAMLPVVFLYTDQPPQAESNVHGLSCLIALIRPALEGHTVVLSKETIGCGGGRCYCGFDAAPRPGLAEFLSCGVPGRFDGLRYKKRPDLVDLRGPYAPASGRYLVTKRIDRVTEQEQPEVVAFLAGPDVLSALYHLAAFATSARDAVICPQGAGCSQILNYPRLEAEQTEPRAVLGLFDLSARPHVDSSLLSLAVPWKRFVQMAGDLEESFLTTEGWAKLKGRA